MIAVADLVLDDDSEDAHPSVGASLAVLAGIAAADAACCAALGKHARGQSHAEAVRLVGSVYPTGKSMGADLQRLVSAKDDAHYGLALVSKNKAKKLVSAARRLAKKATEVVNAHP